MRSFSGAGFTAATVAGALERTALAAALRASSAARFPAAIRAASSAAARVSARSGRSCQAPARRWQNLLGAGEILAADRRVRPAQQGGEQLMPGGNGLRAVAAQITHGEEARMRALSVGRFKQGIGGDRGVHALRIGRKFEFDMTARLEVPCAAPAPVHARRRELPAAR